MNEVDYLKLCEQYVTFLVASAGVSITVLTLVLTFGFKSETQDESAKEDDKSAEKPDKSAEKEVDLRLFLVAALIVLTVYCFTGAQMMTETAGFFSHLKELSAKEKPREATSGNLAPPREKSLEEQQLEEQQRQKKLREEQGMAFGKRLFLLASTNIFITVILLLFSLMLLPTASKKVEPTSIRSISVWIFWVVVACAFGWMCLAVKYRMHAEGSNLDTIIRLTFIFGVVVGSVFCCIKSIKCLLLWTFIPIGCFSAFLLFYFAWIFSDASKPKASIIEVLVLFILPITFSYVSLGITGVKMMFPETFILHSIADSKSCWKSFREWIVGEELLVIVLREE